MCQRLFKGFAGEIEILQLALEVAVVGEHVEVAVAGEVEQQGLGLAGLLALSATRRPRQIGVIPAWNIW
jgi:hypothetical protein